MAGGDGEGGGGGALWAQALAGGQGVAVHGAGAGGVPAPRRGRRPSRTAAVAAPVFAALPASVPPPPPPLLVLSFPFPPSLARCCDINFSPNTVGNGYTRQASRPLIRCLTDWGCSDHALHSVVGSSFIPLHPCSCRSGSRARYTGVTQAYADVWRRVNR